MSTGVEGKLTANARASALLGRTARRIRGHSEAYDLVMCGVRLSVRSYVPRASGECDYERPAPHRALAPYLPRTTLWRSQLFSVSFQPELCLDQDDARESISPSQNHRLG
jgi:hypothetical protein